MNQLLIIIAMVCSAFQCISQEEMINGGFENIDLNVTSTTGYPGPIYYAPPWDNIANTCDVHHSIAINLLTIAGIPRSGEGNGRFVAPANGGLNEFCYGRTNPLVAGETYVVSFWVRKDFSEDRDVPVGAIISENIPTIQTSPIFISSHQPNVTITPLSTQYVQASFCFTAQNSVAHYVSFGPWQSGGSVTVGFYLDDVSVQLLPQGTPLPLADVTIPQTTYCTGDNVTVDGTGSQDETNHVWEIYQLVNGNQQGALEYSSGNIIGTAGTFDITAALGSTQPGDCYRVVLKALGACEDESFVDFCYTDPEIDFIHDGSPVCENTPVDLSVTGENGWTYNWSSGQTGVGLKTVTVTPGIGNETFTVDVTTPEGCTFSRSITLTVHSQNNSAPWMDGVNGTGEYTFYVSSGDFLPPYSFTSSFFNDNNTELLNYFTGTTNLPSQANYSIILPAQDTPNGQMTFSVITGGPFNYEIPPGNYFFTVSATDDNACGNESASFTFNIIVGCDHCPLCISYEDRTPQGTPLPAETKAIDCIQAGITDVVDTGSDDVLFLAGNTIDLGFFFNAGPGFQGIIEPNTCITDCEDCCEDWNGFTYDPVQNYMNFSDGYPETSIWQLTDINHPYCAFNALGYDLVITSQTGSEYHSASYNGSTCCPFQSPAPDNPILNSSIWWDGYTDNIFGNPVRPNDGVYFYLVTLYGCNGATEVLDGFISIYSSSGARTGSNDSTNLKSLVNEETLEAFALEEKREALNETVELVPNPANDYVVIQGVSEVADIQILDVSGKIVQVTTYDGQKLDISSLAAGSYHFRIFVSGVVLYKTLIKR